MTDSRMLDTLSIFRFAKRYGRCRIGQEHGNNTQSWHDFTNIRAKAF